MTHVRIPVPATEAKFADLPFGEQLMIWAMRLWARTDTAKPQVHALLRKGFALAGIEDAHGAFDSLMTMLATTTTRPRGSGARIQTSSAAYLSSCPSPRLAPATGSRSTRRSTNRGLSSRGRARSATARRSPWATAGA